MSVKRITLLACFFSLTAACSGAWANAGDCGLSNIFPEQLQTTNFTSDLSKLRLQPQQTNLVLTKSGSKYSLQAVSLATVRGQDVFLKSLDYEKYPQLKVPGVLETKVLVEGSDSKVVWFHTNLLQQDARYSVNVQYKQTGQEPSPQYLISWDLAQSDDGKLGKMSGQWCISQINETEILIRYDVSLDFHTSIPSFFYAHSLESQMKNNYIKMFQIFTQ